MYFGFAELCNTIADDDSCTGRTTNTNTADAHTPGLMESLEASE